MKIVTIIGARPQFVKAGVVSRAIREHNQTAGGACLKEIIVHTGQHYDKDMSSVFLEQFGIEVDYNLQIHEKLHGKMTAKMLEEIEEVLLREGPDAVMIFGDTNSTLAGALAAAKLHIPIAHVEAGLRSFNMKMPEEVNRIVADRLSRWLFCPTDRAVENLKNEGVGRELEGAIQQTISFVGDVMLDAFRSFERSVLPSPECQMRHDFNDKFYLATIHRSENTDDSNRLSAIMGALDEIATHTPVIIPIHPRTENAIRGIRFSPKHMSFIKPVGYGDMITMLRQCSGVFTDSGGLQKEAYFCRKKCVTIREETEWQELVDYGYNRLVAADPDKIIGAEKQHFSGFVDWQSDLYGDGHAGEKIVRALLGDGGVDPQ